VLARRPNGVWAARFLIEYKVSFCFNFKGPSGGASFAMCSRFDYNINGLKILDFRIFIAKNSTSSG